MAQGAACDQVGMGAAETVEGLRHHRHAPDPGKSRDSSHAPLVQPGNETVISAHRYLAVR